MRRFGLVLAMVMSISLVSSVYAEDKKETKEKKSDKKDIVVEIGNTKITLDDLNKRWDEIPEQARYGITKEKFLDGLIQEELIYQESLKSKVDKTDAYKKALEEVKKQLLVREYLNKEIVDKVKVSDTDINDYYEKNKSNFIEPEKMNAKHILVKTEDEAKEIIKTLGVDKTKFESIAKEKSIDTASGKNGGDLGLFSREDMVKEFSDAAFALKNGEITSTPVKTEYGYHIILAGEKTESKHRELKDVKSEIDRTLIRTKQRETFEQLIDDLKKKTKIKENRDLLK